MESCELPSLRVTTHLVNNRSIHVVRDDILEAGTKERATDFFHELAYEFDNVVTVAAVTGFGQLAVSKMSQVARLNCYIVVAKRGFRSNALTNKTESRGAHYIMVTRSNDLLHYYDPIDRMRISIPSGYIGEQSVTYVSSGLLNKVAEDFADRHPGTYGMGLGLDDPGFIDAIANSIRSNNLTRINPRRMWITVGSGTLVRALSQVWPKTIFMCVQVGRNIDEVIQEVPRARIRVAPYKFSNSVTNHNLLPPFPSLANYDAKAWQFIIDEAENGDYFWNVAGDIPE